ncbi:hypothetical protein AKJ57_05445 [candidate division MSBL1 archaeon SCGC-AAA259A05]|uniref:Replication protein n=1 Tax=candidate division MSBL1 archaeon SCGC-AAA259A05 TaxID=1698259 RepID=A0A133U589_9EURY|nr:hypothetical protein AKJ57_05445 [candidate division MSBL1 archaeon SCGC-AAA259A05]
MVRDNISYLSFKTLSEEDLPSCADSAVWLMCDECGYVHPVPITCGRRTCPDCAYRRFLRLKERYRDLFKELTNPKLLTLTLRRSWDLEELVDQAIDGFRMLRRRKIMEGARGGLYSVEVKPPTEEGWYVHIHVVVEGLYMLQGKLSEEWKNITGDSFVVDIRSLRDPKKGILYVLGYLSSKTKVEETWEGVPEHRKREFEEMVKHRRLIQTFGIFYGTAPTGSDPFECPECGCTEWIFLWVEHMREEKVTLFDWMEEDPPPVDEEL